MDISTCPVGRACQEYGHLRVHRELEERFWLDGQERLSTKHNLRNEPERAQYPAASGDIERGREAVAGTRVDGDRRGTRHDLEFLGQVTREPGLLVEQDVELGRFEIREDRREGTIEERVVVAEDQQVATTARLKACEEVAFEADVRRERDESDRGVAHCEVVAGTCGKDIG